jgi:hypothetical protein
MKALHYLGLLITFGAMCSGTLQASHGSLDRDFQSVSTPSQPYDFVSAQESSGNNNNEAVPAAAPDEGDDILRGVLYFKGADVDKKEVPFTDGSLSADMDNQGKYGHYVAFTLVQARFLLVNECINQSIPVIYFAPFPSVSGILPKSVDRDSNKSNVVVLFRYGSDSPVPYWGTNYTTQQYFDQTISYTILKPEELPTQTLEHIYLISQGGRGTMPLYPAEDTYLRELLAPYTFAYQQKKM